jgi:hypothetical protein
MWVALRIVFYVSVDRCLNVTRKSLQEIALNTNVFTPTISTCPFYKTCYLFELKKAYER